jgi:prevent-host-death family protein
MAKLGLSQVAGIVESAKERLVNVHQAKTNLSQLLQDVERGEEVVIARAGTPIARLVSWSPPPHRVAAPGAMRGAIDVAADFDEPLDELFDALR